MMRRGTFGFTIVELLIVIVVIAILAAIAVVAYNGVQQRADNTARIAAAKDWYKVFQTYLTQNGQYPSGTDNNHFCLAYGYPTNLDGNADEDCFMSSNIKHPSTTPLNALRGVASFPVFPTAKLTASVSGVPTTVVGISMRSHDTLDAKPNYRLLYYWLQGANQDCVLRPVAKIVSNGVWSTGASTDINTVSDGTMTRCVIPLPDPASV
jgi:prepilin-type N-terminal cleavage/methylation domain-containing protein